MIRINRHSSIGFENIRRLAGISRKNRTWNCYDRGELIRGY